MQEEHDFDWLQKLGRVFDVFDQQDSGNISFGVERDGEKVFVKYAGAKTLNFSGETQDAIHNLREAVYLYHELSHPSLIELINHFEVKYSHPESPYYRYKQLTVAERLVSLDSIFSFHAYVEKKGFVAVDFYDGSLLYDFRNNETKICDIDIYQKKPFINTMGRLWGSSRFMSPEEFILGAEIDERTNVFNMGAMAFALIGGELDRSFAKWEAGRGLHEVAIRAVNENRQLRYLNVADFKAAWDLALKTAE